MIEKAEEIKRNNKNLVYITTGWVFKVQGGVSDPEKQKSGCHTQPEDICGSSVHHISVIQRLFRPKLKKFLLK